MERVTFRDPALVERLDEGFVCTFKNTMPGFHGPDLGAEGRKLFGQAAPKGTASTNVATLIALADGTLLHVVPGFFDAKGLEREIDFALTVRDALAKAKKDRKSRERAYVLRHEERIALLGEGAAGAEKKALVFVHRKLAKEPLRDAATVERASEFSEEDGCQPCSREGMEKACKECEKDLEKARELARKHAQGSRVSREPREKGEVSPRSGRAP